MANILSTHTIENGVINSKVKVSKLDNIYLIGAAEEYTLETLTTLWLEHYILTVRKAFCT